MCGRKKVCRRGPGENLSVRVPWGCGTHIGQSGTTPDEVDRNLSSREGIGGTRCVKTPCAPDTGGVLGEESEVQREGVVSRVRDPGPRGCRVRSRRWRSNEPVWGTQGSCHTTRKSSPTDPVDTCVPPGGVRRSCTPVVPRSRTRNPLRPVCPGPSAHPPFPYTLSRGLACTRPGDRQCTRTRPRPLLREGTVGPPPFYRGLPPVSSGHPSCRLRSVCWGRSLLLQPTCDLTDAQYWTSEAFELF